MLHDGIDYNKTVETKRLVFKGQLSEKLSIYILLIIIMAGGLMFCYDTYKSHLKENSIFINYLYTSISLIFVLILIFIIYKRLSNRDKLKEIEARINVENAKKKLIKAASNLNWNPDIIERHYIIFQTKYEFSKDCQSVTLIFFPDNRVYYNSLHYPNNYWKPARYMENYQSLMSEYLKIKEE